MSDALVLDMHKVDYINSTGISVILKTRAALERREGELIMVNLQPQVQHVFEIIDLLPTLSVFRSTAELDDYITKIQTRIIEEGTSLSSE